MDFITFEGKTIIVTGAASGIGNATAKLLNKLGARCLLLDINGDALAENDPAPDRNMIRAVDLTAFDQVSDVINDARHEFFMNGGGLTA
ncbi:MAG: SDR family NAD(P)-dependent oxidoreductase [Selenomonadaceae bacterium]|nr:SDR family NAD(P)-dependent oxidoreductase [Selenomonadaceae bacterium]